MGVWQMVHLPGRKDFYKNRNGTSSWKKKMGVWGMVHLPQIKMYKRKMGVWQIVHLTEREDVYKRIWMVHLPEKKDRGLI